MKKLLCIVIGVVLTVLELMLFKVKFLTAFVACVLPVGYTSLSFIALTDYLQDKIITKLMIASYSTAFCTVALLGAAIQLSNYIPFAIACLCAIASAICYFFNKKNENRECKECSFT